MKSFIINSFAKWLVGGDLYNSVKEIVNAYVDSRLSGTQKRELVKKQVRELFSDVSDFAINLAIELAVYYLKSKTK